MAIKLSFRWNCLLKIIAVAISIAIFLPIITQLYNKKGQEESTFHSRKVFVTDIDELSSRATDLKKHLDELDQIKMRALNDLREFEGKRYSMQEEIKKFTSERDKVKTELLQYNKKFAKINKDLEKLKVLAAVHEKRKAVPIGIPRSLEQGRIVPIISDKTAGNLSTRIGCQYSTCIDFSKCPITSTFSFYVYKPIKLDSLLLDDSWAAKVYENLVGLPDYRSDGSTSCFFVVIMCLKSRFRFLKKHYHILNSYLKDLHYWQGNGRNHLLLLLFNGKNAAEFQTSKLQHSNGVLATNYLDIDTHRRGFDLLLFSFESLPKTTDLWEVSPPLVPIERKYFFAYYHLGVASIKSSSSLLVQIIRIKGNMSDICITCNCSNLKRTLEGSDCIKAPWESILKNSIFNLLIGSDTDRVTQSHILHNILESLKTGTIPVLVADNIALPLDDLIDWQKAMFIFPSARLPEVHYILRSIPEEDIFQFKKHGKFLLETYFVSLSSYLKVILTAIQFKLKLPPSPLGDYHAIPVLRNADKLTSDTETQFGTLLSSKFNHNWSYTGSNLHKIWNEFPGALYMLPVMPTSQSHPASVQFVLRRSDFMPIGNGEGGDGEVFSKALGGDFPLEHFTVVMLTYDREIILVESIQRLAGLKYLDKVVVVWNNPASPSDELKWPEIGVPLHVSNFFSSTFPCFIYFW